MNVEVDTMTVKELKQELKSRELKINGNKAELKERLSHALQSNAPNHKNGNTEQQQQHDEEVHDSTIKDFEEYINDEFKRLHGMASEDDASAPKRTESDFEEAPVEPQKVMADFSDANDGNTSDNQRDDDDDGDTHEDADAIANNHLEAPVVSEADKVESRKRRFGNLHQTDLAPPVKKPRTDQLQLSDEERKKIIERAHKFGTKIPGTIALTQAESASVFAEQIQRAKRFGTEHLLPMRIQNAEFDAKKNERMKRFNTNAKGQVVETSTKEDQAKVVERKLRFGTLADDDDSQQSPQPATAYNKNAARQKVNPRQSRNNERIQRFRNYKKQKQNHQSQPTQSQFQTADERERIEQRKLRFLK